MPHKGKYKKSKGKKGKDKEVNPFKEKMMKKGSSKRINV